MIEHFENTINTLWTPPRSEKVWKCFRRYRPPKIILVQSQSSPPPYNWGGETCGVLECYRKILPLRGWFTEFCNLRSMGTFPCKHMHIVSAWRSDPTMFVRPGWKIVILIIQNHICKIKVFKIIFNLMLKTKSLHGSMLEKKVKCCDATHVLKYICTTLSPGDCWLTGKLTRCGISFFHQLSLEVYIHSSTATLTKIQVWWDGILESIPVTVYVLCVELSSAIYRTRPQTKSMHGSSEILRQTPV